MDSAIMILRKKMNSLFLQKSSTDSAFLIINLGMKHPNEVKK